MMNRKNAVEKFLIDSGSHHRTVQLSQLEIDSIIQSLAESYARIELLTEQARRAGHDADTAAIETEIRAIERALDRSGLSGSGYLQQFMRFVFGLAGRDLGNIDSTNTR